MLQEIAPNIFLVHPPGKGRFPYCYCLYIADDTRALFDSSCGDENLQLLRQLGVDLLVNTHFHEDHIWNNHRFPEANIWAHQQDAGAIRSIDNFIGAYGCHLFEGARLGQEFLDQIQLQPSPVHRELQDGDVIDLGQVRFSIVHTPGHTPGHCALWEPRYGILVSGDIDLSGFGPWYGHLCSDLNDLLDSIEKCRQLQPRVIVSGHKGLVDDNLDQRLQAFRDIVLRREEAVLEALDQPYTVPELAARQLFYGPRIPQEEIYFWFEKMAIYQHLQRLLRLGLVNQQGELYYRVT